MATYGLYQDIDENALKSAVKSIRSSATNKQGELNRLNTSDSRWIASAKETFYEGITKLSTEPFTELYSQLDALDAAASNISSYKENEKAANKNKEIKEKLINDLNNYDDAESRAQIQSNINEVNASIEECEKNMDACQRAIEG